MRRLYAIATICLLALTVQAQTQRGYVKTKGRMGTEKVIPGKRISGATIMVKGRAAALSDAQGNFSFPILGDTYYLQQVQKKDYELTDLDQLSRSYTYSATRPLVIVMEHRDQRIADLLAAEQKIRRSLSKQLQKREAEIELLKEAQKITEKEYQKQLQQLYQSQESNERLISEMADHYARIDYDQLNEFNRQLNGYILNGELSRADSLLRTRGDIATRIEELYLQQKANAQVRAKLVRSEAYVRQNSETIAQDCFNHFEIEKMRHNNDSAAYYIELRTMLDESNVQWLFEAGEFVQEYLVKYDKAMSYYQRALQQALLQYGENHTLTAMSYNYIGTAYKAQEDIEEALVCYEKALAIRSQACGEHHPDVADCYNYIGTVYDAQGDYIGALEYYEKALNIYLDVYGENHPAVATSYYNIGIANVNQGDSYKALEYYEKSLAIRLQSLGEKHSDVAASYNNIGLVYDIQGESSKALEYYEKAKKVYLDVYGENHPSVAMSYKSMASLYNSAGDYAKTLECYEKSLQIELPILGENHPTVAATYYNIGGVYRTQGDYTKTLEYYAKSLEIDLETHQENHPSVATDYNNIGSVYEELGNYTKALEYYEKVLQIRLACYDESHFSVESIKENIEEVKSML